MSKTQQKWPQTVSEFMAYCDERIKKDKKISEALRRNSLRTLAALDAMEDRDAELWRKREEEESKK